MVIFHSYVSLPEGISWIRRNRLNHLKKKKTFFRLASEIVQGVFVLIFFGILNKPTTAIPIVSTNHHNWMGKRYGVVWKKGYPKIQWFIKTFPVVISLFGHTYPSCSHIFPYVPFNVPHVPIIFRMAPPIIFRTFRVSSWVITATLAAKVWGVQDLR